jgi:hypothetical protein
LSDQEYEEQMIKHNQHNLQQSKNIPNTNKKLKQTENEILENRKSKNIPNTDVVESKTSDYKTSINSIIKKLFRNNSDSISQIFPRMLTSINPSDSTNLPFIRT